VHGWVVRSHIYDHAFGFGFNHHHDLRSPL